MSITLNATLKTAQDGNSHRPIIDLLSSPMSASIPLQGNYFNTDSTTESNQGQIVTSGGRLANVYIRSGANLYYYYTDTSRIQWQTPVSIGVNCIHASLCEMADGNIGIIYVTSGYDIYYKIITVTGASVGGALISTGHSWVGGASVIKLDDDSYICVYADGSAEPPGDGDTYNLQKITSSNFTSWGSPSAITLAGLSTSYRKDNPDLLQVTNGRLFLHFDYTNSVQNAIELRNIYGMYSDNNGSSWNTPYAITSYDTYGDQGIRPSASERQDGSVYIIYQEVNTVKHYDTGMDGYPGSEHFDGGQIQYDHATQMLIVNNIGQGGAGFNDWENVTQIDTATDEFVTHWDGSTSPVMPEPERLCAQRCAYDTYPFCIFSAGSACNKIIVLNIEDDSVTQYIPEDTAGWNIETGKVDDTYTWYLWENIFGVYREVGSQRRLYILMQKNGTGIQGKMKIGYVDLDEVADPVTGRYTWHEECTKYESDWPLVEEKTIGFAWLSEINLWMVSFPTGIMTFTEDWTVMEDLRSGTVPGFPVGDEWGVYAVQEAVYISSSGTTGSYYFSFQYNSSYPDRRGICRYDRSTETCYYYEPNWFTCTTDCGLHNLYNMGDGRILMSCSASGCSRGGIAILDTDGHSWTHYSEDNIPGMINPYPSHDYPDCDDWRWDYGASYLSYDPVTQTIFAGYRGYEYWEGDSPTGIIVFSELGAYSTIRYGSITDVDTTPAYSAFSDFTLNDFEYNGAIAVDEDDVAWLTWDHMDSVSENSLQWDNTVSDKQVEDMLVNGSVLSITWEIDKPTKLEFELSHGQFFDTSNLLSTWSVYFKKGRVLTLQLGERISDTDYLQVQGEFIVDEAEMSYSQKYPTIRVKAEDLRAPWGDTHIIASEYFSDITPKTVTENLLVDHGDMTSQDYDIPTYDNTHNLYHQFIDMSLAEAVQLIMDHFGYFGFVNVDGEFEPRKIRTSGTPDHTYTGTEIIEYSPDGKYATWTNRIIVTGMSNVYSEVLFEQESITTISGTVGHWGGDKDITVYYSDDKERVCRDPRLEIIMSVSEFEVWGIGGGGAEEISYIDPEEKYFIITIDIPDFTGILIATIAAIIALGTAAIWCDGFISGWCGAAIFALTVLLNIALQLLGAVASYSYRIWARPVGHERATFQAQADDEEFQRILNGKIVPETIDDPFCYSIGECYRVANLELGVVMAQRSRIKYKKDSHLMDEIGDILRVNHPKSGETVDTFVAKLKRDYKIGGETTDQIEGWRLS